MSRDAAKPRHCTARTLVPYLDKAAIRALLEMEMRLENATGDMPGAITNRERPFRTPDVGLCTSRDRDHASADEVQLYQIYQTTFTSEALHYTKEPIQDYALLDCGFPAPFLQEKGTPARCCPVLRTLSSIILGDWECFAPYLGRGWKRPRS